MSREETDSAGRAIRPSTALPPRPVTCSPRMRHPQEQMEIERRVVIYARQVERTGQIAWLPHRGEGRGA